MSGRSALGIAEDQEFGVGHLHVGGLSFTAVIDNRKKRDAVHNEKRFDFVDRFFHGAVCGVGDNAIHFDLTHEQLAPGKGDECVFHLLPDAGTGIDDFKVSNVFKRDEFNVFAGLFLFGGIRLADFVRD